MKDCTVNEVFSSQSVGGIASIFSNVCDLNVGDECASISIGDTLKM